MKWIYMRTVSGKGGWTISRAAFSGRWVYDRHREILQLDMSGGISQGTESMLVEIVSWEEDFVARCRFRGHDARLERLPG